MNSVLQNAVRQMRQEVENLEANRLLNTAPEDLKNYLVQKYWGEPIALRRDQWHADHQEAQVDVRYDQSRWIRDTSCPVMIPGERFEVRVPFEGESELFYTQPNAWSSSPPRAIVETNELVLRYDSPSDAPRDIRPLVGSRRTPVQGWLAWNGLPGSASTQHCC